jgi:hypothetical protein
LGHFAALFNSSAAVNEALIDEFPVGSPSSSSRLLHLVTLQRSLASLPHQVITE